MRFRLIIKCLDGKALFPSRHLSLDDVKQIINANGKEDSKSVLRAIKSYTEEVRTQTFTFTYEDVVSSIVLSELFARKSVRIVFLNPESLERTFMFKGRNLITGYDCIYSFDSLERVIAKLSVDEWLID